MPEKVDVQTRTMSDDVDVEANENVGLSFALHFPLLYVRLTLPIFGSLIIKK